MQEMFGRGVTPEFVEGLRLAPEVDREIEIISEGARDPQRFEQAKNDILAHWDNVFYADAKQGGFPESWIQKDREWRTTSGWLDMEARKYLEADASDRQNKLVEARYAEALSDGNNPISAILSHIGKKLSESGLQSDPLHLAFIWNSRVRMIMDSIERTQNDPDNYPFYIFDQGRRVDPKQIDPDFIIENVIGAVCSATKIPRMELGNLQPQIETLRERAISLAA